jgi:uncharacterized protein (DUF1501 family)
MIFSEFGRRVPENTSLGTDHGTANLMFAAGNSVSRTLPPFSTEISKR